MALVRDGDRVVEVPDMLPQAPLPLGPLQGMPPARPLQSQQPQAPERPEGGGFLETLGQYASSDTGRSLLGALAVGLSGVRNAQDQGQFQQQIMQTVLQGSRERRQARTQEESMGALLDAVGEANRLVSAGDLEGASRAIGGLSRIPALRRNPQAVQYVLTLQQQLADRAGTRGAIRELREGAQTRIPAQPPRLEGSLAPGEDPEAAALLPRTPGAPARTVQRPITAEDLLSLAESRGDLGLVQKLSSLAPKPQAPVPHWDDESRTLFVFNPGTRTMDSYPMGDQPRGLKLSQITGKSRTALEGLLAQGGVNIQDWLSAYNKRDPYAMDIWRRATEQGGEADLRSEAERSARRQLDADIESGKVPKPETDTQYQGLIAKYVQQRAVRVAGAKAYAGEVHREEAELQQSPMRALRQGGGIVELGSGQYKDVTRSYKTMREANQDQGSGKVTVIYSPDQLKAVRAGRNTLNNFKNIREIGNQLYTRDDVAGVLKQGGLQALGAYTGLGPLSGPAREMQAMMVAVFDTAKAFGNDARISDADARYALQAQGNTSWFQKREDFNRVLDRMEKIITQGLRRTARDERVESEPAQKEDWVDLGGGVRMRRTR